MRRARRVARGRSASDHDAAISHQRANLSGICELEDRRDCGLPAPISGLVLFSQRRRRPSFCNLGAKSKMRSSRSLVVLVFTLTVVALIAQSSAVAQSARRPNIVYILADDLGWKDVGFHGSDIKTPNIDELARTGARLEQFYAQPMCTPTRAALMTGRYPVRYGLQTLVIPASMSYGLPTDEWLLPQALKEAGYATAIIGKWHLGHAQSRYWPMQRGFDYQYGPLLGEIDYYTHAIGGKTDWFRNEKPLKEQGYVSTLLGEDAVHFIERQDANKPFFLYLAFTAPHTPFQAPQKYLAMYADISDSNRRSYAAMITAMDDQIGAVMQALQRRGLRDNTVVIFHSDNGGNQSPHLAGESEVKGKLPADNGPYRGGKGDLYEGGMRVASLINWHAKIPAGTVIDQTMHVVDYYPTLVNLAGGSLAKSKPLDGLDLAHDQRGQTLAARRGYLQRRAFPWRGSARRLEARLARDPALEARIVQPRPGSKRKEQYGGSEWTKSQRAA